MPRLLCVLKLQVTDTHALSLTPTALPKAPLTREVDERRQRVISLTTCRIIENADQRDQACKRAVRQSLLKPRQKTTVVVRMSFSRVCGTGFRFMREPYARDRASFSQEPPILGVSEVIGPMECSDIDREGD